MTTQKTLVQINSSLFSDQGQSSTLADQFVAKWQATHADGKVVRHDLVKEEIPHLDGARFAAFLTKPEERNEVQKDVAAFSDRLINELRVADTLVIGLPLYNFGVPSHLKAYFDHVARAGETFKYTASGPEGLLTGKKAYIFATRGGQYSGTPLDTQTSYVRDFLAFVGITDVTFVYAEGLAYGDDAKGAALAQAQQQLVALPV
ncbi:MAG TPA: NAD(P)H-dependent oxidoreductase [Rhodocyclaceae bacterium]|jgi:FMN-dependent NADH-azoreductase|nr:NAD(P)H-dependent oxidoreductase [Rhodocyclaceae bacterium]